MASKPVLNAQNSFVKPFEVDGNKPSAPILEKKPSNGATDDQSNRSTGSKEQRISGQVASGQTERNSSNAADAKPLSPDVVVGTRQDTEGLSRSNRSFRGEVLFEKVESQGGNISFGISPIKDTRRGAENRLEDDKDDSGLASPVARQERGEAKAKQSPSKNQRVNRSGSSDGSNLAEVYNNMKVIKISALFSAFYPINPA